MTGAPVAAKAMTFSPSMLFTGLRTNDSLADGESYFFAELKRLQSVVESASTGNVCSSCSTRYFAEPTQPTSSEGRSDL